jgi:hypothetical protein
VCEGFLEGNDPNRSKKEGARREIVKNKQVTKGIGKTGRERSVKILIVQGGGANEDKNKNTERLIGLVDRQRI